MIRRTAVMGALICAAWAMNAEAQHTHGGGGGGGWGGPRVENPERLEEMRIRMEASNALNVDAMWAILSFGLGLAPEQLDPVRGPFAAAWNKRALVLANADKVARPDWGAIRDEFKDMKKDLDQRLKAILNEDQRKAFSKEVKAYEKVAARFQGVGPARGEE